MAADDYALRLRSTLHAVQKVGNGSPSATGKILREAMHTATPTDALAELCDLYRNVRNGLLSLDTVDQESRDDLLLQIAPLGDWIGSIQMLTSFNKMPELDERALGFLSTASHLLQTSRPTSAIDADDVVYIREQVVELLNDIEQADNLEATLRRFLHVSCMSLLDALDSYAHRGTRGLVDVVETTIGKFATMRPTTADDPGFMDRIRAICRDAMVLAGGVGGLMTLGGYVDQAFEVLDRERPAVVQFEDPPALEPVRPAELNPSPDEAESDN